MSTAWRTVRVYLCSTFDDMHAEVASICSRSFFPPCASSLLLPGRAARCRSALGVGREQVENEKGLLLALEQIDECRPFFIALVGGRYGWSPQENCEELRRKYPWVARLRPARSPRRGLACAAVSSWRWSRGAQRHGLDVPGPVLCPRSRSPGDHPRRHPPPLVRRDPGADQAQLTTLRRIEGCGYPIEHYSCRWSDEDPLPATGASRDGWWNWRVRRARPQLALVRHPGRAETAAPGLTGDSSPGKPAPVNWVAEENALQERTARRAGAFMSQRTAAQAHAYAGPMPTLPAW